MTVRSMPNLQQELHSQGSKIECLEVLRRELDRTIAYLNNIGYYATQKVGFTQKQYFLTTKDQDVYEYMIKVHFLYHGLKENVWHWDGKYAVDYFVGHKKCSEEIFNNLPSC